MKTIGEVAAFHGHICPGLAIGYRVSQAALRALGKRAKDEELVAIVENNSCAVDAVQLMTGCTFGKGNLIFKDYGKQVYTFIKRPSGKAIRISLKWEPKRESASGFGEVGPVAPSEAVQRVLQRRRKNRIKEILSAPEKELLEVKTLKMTLPEEAKIYPSVRCECCGEKVMEPRARLRDGKVLCIPCFERQS